MDVKLNEYLRKSFIEIGEIYFWTATINKLQRLLQSDAYKQVIISSLEYLSNTPNAAVRVRTNHIINFTQWM